GLMAATDTSTVELLESMASDLSGSSLSYLTAKTKERAGKNGLSDGTSSPLKRSKSMSKPAKTYNSWHLCVVGGAPSAMPALPGVTFEKSISAETNALIALPGANATRIYRGLWANQASLMPIIDAGAELPRSDITIPAPSVEHITMALGKLTALRNRLETIPPVGEDQREKFLPLAMAYSRDTILQAKFAPNKAHVTSYPALTGIPISAETLTSLANDGLLTPRFFQRVHECSHCQSARLIAQEECEACHSSNIEPVPVIHHYSCGHQGLRPQFVQGDKLICPKCNDRLRHYGVDYDVSGELTHCHDCGHQSGDVEVGFVCMDCGGHTPAKDSVTRDINHYELTADGVQAVLSGALPGLLGQDGEPARIISVEEFDRLVILEQRRTRRSNSPHVVMRVMLQASAERAQELGLASLNSLYAQASNVIAERLRDSDLVAWRGSRIYLLMPDTPADNAPVVVNKLGSALNDLFGMDPQFDLLDTDGGTTTTTAETNWSPVTTAA
ncbi:MAG: hypothetical protein AAF213_02775, partial [Pseudomonadota bacterium]